MRILKLVYRPIRKVLKRIYRSFVPEPVPVCDSDTITVLTATLRRDSNAIDVGCNRGSILREILRLAPEGKHFVFEPIPALHRQLCRRFPTVDCRRIALSDEAGTIQFTHYTQLDGFSGMVRRDLGGADGAPEEISVATERLDAIVPANLPIALVKIDVEGAEYRVLRGAEAMLRRCRPVIVFECGKGGLDVYGHSPEQVFDFLESCGLTIAKLSNWSRTARSYRRQEFVDEFWAGKEFMFVASPRGA